MHHDCIWTDGGECGYTSHGARDVRDQVDIRSVVLPRAGSPCRDASHVFAVTVGPYKVSECCLGLHTDGSDYRVRTLSLACVWSLTVMAVL